MRRYHLEGLVLLVCSFSCSVVFADDTVSPRRAAAAKLLERGLASFHSRAFDKAIEEFRAGFALDPLAKFLFAIAQAQRLQGDCEHAVESYRDFLQTGPSRRQARLAERLMQQPCVRPAEVATPMDYRSRSSLSSPMPAPKLATVALANPRAASRGVAEEPRLPRGTEPAPSAVAEKHDVSVAPVGEPASRLKRDPSVPFRKHWYRDSVGISFAVGGVLVVATGAGLFAAGHGWISDAEHAGDYSRFATSAPRAVDGVHFEYAAVGLFAIGGGLVAAATVRLAIVGRRR